MKCKTMSCKIKTNKAMYLGDPCYVLADDLYQQWGEQRNWKDGVIKAGDSEWCAGGTAFGDGCYYDNDSDTEYGVDAGVLGLVPLEIIDDEDCAIRLGRVIEEAGEYEFEDEDGYFTITTPSGKVITIDTDADYDEDFECCHDCCNCPHYDNCGDADSYDEEDCEDEDEEYDEEDD